MNFYVRYMDMLRKSPKMLIVIIKKTIKILIHFPTCFEIC